MGDLENSVVSIELGDRGYDIVIGHGLIESAATYIKPHLSGNKVIIVTDKQVAEHYLEPLKKALAKDVAMFEPVVIDGGEASKSFQVLEGVIDQFLSQKIDRSTTVIALGGGVVGDLAGFASAIALRGINFIQVPTTLLAQVDSSVGGKTGINTKHGKNLVGAFYQPKLVLIDVDVLQSLPKRELLAGYAEVVKYGLIDRAEFFEWLEGNGEGLLDGQHDNLINAIHLSCAAKAEIVAQDEREGGVRALLNLGHTFGHALEAEAGYDGALIHGEAVAIGMVMAFEFSAFLGKCSQSDVERVKAHLKAVGLPVSPSEKVTITVGQFMDHVSRDKKVRDGKLTFILAKGIGQSYIDKEIDENSLREYLTGVLS